MRKILYALTIVALVAAGLYTWRYELGWRMTFLLKPAHDFDLALTGPAPEYAVSASWIRRSQTEAADGAVFYIHPTTLLRAQNWNQTLDDARQDAFLDFLAPQQMAVFEGLPVFAPYYRQAAFYSFIGTAQDSADALDLAAEDVVAAFRAFAAERPDEFIIIAGHSQGAYHALRILNEVKGEPDLLNRIAVVYAIGYPFPDWTLHEVSPLPPCGSSGSVNCILSYNVRGENAYIPPFFEQTPLPFDNLTRRNGDAMACWNPAGENSVVRGQCAEGGWLVIEQPPREYRQFLMSRAWYHTVEFDLFAEELRGDALQRLAAITGRSPDTDVAPDRR